MNISAISVSTGVMPKRKNPMNFGMTRGQLALDVFTKSKNLKIEEDLVNSLTNILENQKKSGIKFDEAFREFVSERKQNLIKLRAEYLKANKEYIESATALLI